MKLTVIIYKEHNQNAVRVFGSSIEADKFISEKKLKDNKYLKLTDNTQSLLPIFLVEFWSSGWRFFTYCTKDVLSLNMKLAEVKSPDEQVRYTQLRVKGMEEI